MASQPGTDEGQRPDPEGQARIPYTLTQRGWCEAMGISSAAAEVLSGGLD